MLTDFAGVPVCLEHQYSGQFALHHRRQVRQRLDVQQLVVDHLNVVRRPLCRSASQQ